jgi:hypothetical protein
LSEFPARGSNVAAGSSSGHPQPRRAAPPWRGFASAAALVLYTILGALGAFLTLLPLAWRRAPAGRTSEAANVAGAKGERAAARREALPG